jgi:hypothetical protein
MGCLTIIASEDDNGQPYPAWACFALNRWTVCLSSEMIPSPLKSFDDGCDRVTDVGSGRIGLIGGELSWMDFLSGGRLFRTARQ